jgi:hypothetical protein
MKKRNITITILIVMLGFLALSPIAQALSPAPDGGYPGGNTAEGQQALFGLTNGTFNTAVGIFSLLSNTEGNFNTALGAGTLLANVGSPSTGEGIQNTATGAGALLSNTTGFDNTANGAFALFTNAGGAGNTATGTSALFSNTTGSDNTADGTFALISNIGGSSNTAVGRDALFFNTSGDDNTAIGRSALGLNGTGFNNTAVGLSALGLNTTGNSNTAVGWSALGFNVADGNTAVGVNALALNITGTQNTGVGLGALFSSTGNNNTALGYGAGADVTGDSNIDIGVQVRGLAGESNTIRIGDNLPTGGQSNCYIGGINSESCDPDSCFVVGADINNKLGTNTGPSAGIPLSTLGDTRSSRRFKDNIRPMAKASEAILALEPVAFHYKDDSTGATRFGLIAEQVAQVDPELVALDKEGKPYRVRYDQVNAMLLNEFLKEHRRVHELEQGMAGLTAQLKEQAAQIQKVSAQIEMTKPTTKVVLNNQ